MAHTAAPTIDIATFRTLLEHAPGYISIFDADRRMRYTNRVADGYDLEKVVGMRVEDFLSPEQVDATLSRYEEARRTGEHQITEYYLEPAGERLWFCSRIAPLYDGDGSFIGYINVTTEITEQKRAEHALKRTQADLLEASHRAGMAEVATGVLHNVGNVINSVNVSAASLMDELSGSHIDLLVRTVDLCGEQGTHLPEFLASDPRGRKMPALLGRLTDEIMAEQQRLRAEVKRLVEHVNIIRSTVEAQQSIAKTGKLLEEVKPRELVDRAMSMFRIDLDSHRIDALVDIEDNPPMRLDRQGTLQILVSLIRNAIEALTEVDWQRTLRIKVCLQGDTLRFEVEDNGCGISADNLAKLFRHGFTTKKSGHGFGLHTSVIAARAMGGSLDGQSAGTGQGARFCLALPLHLAHQDSPRPVPAR